MADNNTKNQTPQVEPLDLGILLHDMFRGFLRYWYIGLALTLCLSVFGAWRAISAYSPTYRSTATFTVSTQQAGGDNYNYSFYYDKSTASQLVSTFPYIRQSDLFNDRLLEKLGRNYVGAAIQASSVANSNMFTLTVTSSDGEMALQVLEAALAVYPEVAVYVLGDIQLNMLDAPKLPTEPYNRLEWLTSASKLGLLGIALFMGLLLMYAMTRNTLRKEADMEQKLQLPSLGVIPLVTFKKRSQRIDRSLSIRNDKTGFAFQESFRGLGLRTGSQLQEHNAKILGVTAAAKGEGASTVAINLARAMAETGKQVIFVDGHFQQPTRKLRAQGLDSCLQGQCTLEETLAYLEKDKLHVITCAKAMTPQQIFENRRRLQGLMQKLAQQADYVIIDLPPCDQTTQTTVAVELCEALMLVAWQDNLKVSRLMDCVEDLSRFEAILLGGVMNGAKSGLGGYGYSYGYHYGKYGYSRYGSYGRYGGYGRHGGSYGYGEGKRKRK